MRLAVYPTPSKTSLIWREWQNQHGLSSELLSYMNLHGSSDLVDQRLH